MEWFVANIDFRTLPLAIDDSNSDAIRTPEHLHLLTQLGSCFTGLRRLQLRNASAGQVSAFFSQFPIMTSNDYAVDPLMVFLCYDETAEDNALYGASGAINDETHVDDVDPGGSESGSEQTDESTTMHGRSASGSSTWRRFKQQGVQKGVYDAANPVLQHLSSSGLHRQHCFLLTSSSPDRCLDESAAGELAQKYLRPGLRSHLPRRRQESEDSTPHRFSDSSAAVCEQYTDSAGNTRYLLCLPVLAHDSTSTDEQTSQVARQITKSAPSAEELELLATLRTATNLFDASDALELGLHRARLAVLAQFIHSIVSRQEQAESTALVVVATSILLRYPSLSPLLHRAIRQGRFALPSAESVPMLPASSCEGQLRLQCVLAHRLVDAPAQVFVSHYEEVLMQLLTTSRSCVLSIVCMPVDLSFHLSVGASSTHKPRALRLCERLLKQQRWRALSHTLLILRAALMRQLGRALADAAPCSRRRLQALTGGDALWLVYRRPARATPAKSRYPRGDSDEDRPLDPVDVSDEPSDDLDAEVSDGTDEKLPAMQALRSLNTQSERLLLAAMLLFGPTLQLRSDFGWGSSMDTHRDGIHRTNYVDVSARLWAQATASSVSVPSADVSSELLLALYLPYGASAHRQVAVPLLRAVIDEEVLLRQALVLLKRSLPLQRLNSLAILDVVALGSTASRSDDTAAHISHSLPSCFFRCASHHQDASYSVNSATGSARDGSFTQQWRRLGRRLSHAILCRLSLLRHVLKQLLRCLVGLSEEDRAAYTWDYSLPVLDMERAFDDAVESDGLQSPTLRGIREQDAGAFDERHILTPMVLHPLHRLLQQFPPIESPEQNNQTREYESLRHSLMKLKKELCLLCVPTATTIATIRSSVFVRSTVNRVVPCPTPLQRWLEDSNHAEQTQLQAADDVASDQWRF
jgi:hypothetical protein